MPGPAESATRRAITAAGTAKTSETEAPARRAALSQREAAGRGDDGGDIGPNVDQVTPRFTQSRKIFMGSLSARVAD